jgi:hypothetical protein
VSITTICQEKDDTNLSVILWIKSKEKAKLSLAHNRCSINPG